MVEPCGTVGGVVLAVSTVSTKLLLQHFTSIAGLLQLIQNLINTSRLLLGFGIL